MIEISSFPGGNARGTGTWVALKRRLKPFLLSLVNATLLLAITFAVTALILVNRIEGYTATVISEVKFGVLQEFDKDVRAVAGAIRTTNTKLQAIADELDIIIRSPTITLSPAMQHDVRVLLTSLKSVQQSIGKLTSSHEELSDQSIRTIGATVADTIIDIRQCRPRPAEPDQATRKS